MKSKKYMKFRRKQEKTLMILMMKMILSKIKNIRKQKKI